MTDETRGGVRADVEIVGSRSGRGSMPVFSGAISGEEANHVYRPIQYLGSKLRALDELKAQVSALVPPGSHVLDIFSGSTVVAQAFARLGLRVTATDVMTYSMTFGKSLLGVGKPRDEGHPDHLAEIIFAQRPIDNLQDVFISWLDQERAALSDRNSDVLFSIANRLPQIWRPKGASVDLARVFESLTKRKDRSALDIGGIISTHYAGTYFGLHQAITIDSLRLSIEHLYETRQISEWHYHSALTALLSTLSASAYTPGKHFAQYHRITKNKDLSFHRSRILTDRRIDIRSEFIKSLQQIYSASKNVGNGHHAYSLTLEDIFTDSRSLESVDLIYADPPYTAQQYSRFYHIPEILVTYRVPQLQSFRGGHTAGLYPHNKFKSRFSSRAHAGLAFEDLLVLSKRLNAHLIISYSDTESGKTGNKRMISLDALYALCKQHSSDVEIVTLPHRYRQFNATVASVDGRADSEYIILVKRPC